MPTMDIPGIGNVEKKYVYISAAGIAGFVAYMYWKSKQNADVAGTAEASTEGTAVDPGNNNTADYAGYMGDYSGMYDYSGSVPTYQSPPSVYVPVPSSNTITTNGAWDAAAVDAAGTLGLEAAALSSALGNYLAGRCLTAVQADMVRAVEGMFGKPPQSPSLTIKVCPGSPTGGKAPAPTGFKVTGTDKHGVTLTWKTVPNAQMYLITIMGGPEKFKHEVTDPAPPYRFGALTKSSTYRFKVRAIVGGVPGASSATISGKTKAK